MKRTILLLLLVCTSAAAYSQHYRGSYRYGPDAAYRTYSDLGRIAQGASIIPSIAYHCEVDVGYTAGIGSESYGRFNIHSVQGISFREICSVGVGIGMDIYHGTGAGAQLMVPMYLDIKGYFPIDPAIRPYAYGDLGVGICSSDGFGRASGLYLGFGIGLRYSIFKFQVGYNYQHLPDMYYGKRQSGIQFRIGVMF